MLAAGETKVNGTKEVLAKVDINGDGILDHVIKSQFDKDAFEVELFNNKGDAFQLGRASSPIRPGIYRFVVGAISRIWSGKPDEITKDFRTHTSKGIFGIGDIVQLPQGGVGEIYDVVYDINQNGQVLSSLAYYLSGETLKVSEKGESLKSLQIVYSSEDWVAKVDQGVSVLNKEYATLKKEMPRETTRRETALKYADRKNLKEPYKSEVVQIEQKLEKRLSELAPKTIRPEVLKLFLYAAKVKWGMESPPSADQGMAAIAASFPTPPSTVFTYSVESSKILQERWQPGTVTLQLNKPALEALSAGDPVHIRLNPAGKK